MTNKKSITREEVPDLVAAAEAILTSTAHLGVLKINGVVAEVSPAALLALRDSLNDLLRQEGVIFLA